MSDNKEFMITEEKDSDKKQKIVRQILEALPDWFGIEESREEYIAGSAEWPLFAAYDNEKPIGFLCLKETGKETIELCVMGVLKEYHRHGIGRKLFYKAKDVAKEMGYSFMQVKTVQMGKYEDYDDTNRFYRSVGFKEFEVFPLLWDEANPCQIYVMSL
jgi:GNAT superfamily N-acetyltransferase